MTLTDKVRATGLTTRPHLGIALSSDWASTPLTYLPSSSSWVVQDAWVSLPEGWMLARSFEALHGAHSYWSVSQMAASAGEHFSTGPRRYLSIMLEEDEAPMVGFAAVLERRMNELLAMSAGWNGGRGLEISGYAAKVAVPLVFDILANRPLLPQLFPLPDGGLQFEWHVEGSSIEIEVEPDGSVFAIAQSPDRGVLIEQDVDDATLKQLREFLAEMVKRAG